MKKNIFIIMILLTNWLYGQQTIKNLQWLDFDTEITGITADKGVTLYAETENIDDEEIVKLTIWEKGDETDDLVGEYISRVKDNKIVFYWSAFFDENNLQNCFYEIKNNGFTSPQYYFIINYNRIKSQPSKSINVFAWIKRKIVDRGTNLPWINTKYTLLLPDDTEIEGWTDAEGYIRLEGIKAIGEVLWYLQDTEEFHEVEPPYQEPIKPLYYKIKENDNLWKIAAYDFIYGNPYFWRILYESNKHNFINNEDPNLIEVGQVLIIPVVDNETREGTR